MRCLLVILTVLLCLLVPGQVAVGQVRFIDTGLLRTLKLQTSRGNTEPVLSGEKPVNLLVFLSPECPLCINYTKTLNELAKQYDGKAKIIGIVPGKSYSLTMIDSFSMEYNLGFPLYVDGEKKITQLVKATVTPEVIMFSNDGGILYRGAIDDWAIDLGKKKLSAPRPYLGDAIAAHLAGNPVVLKKTKPVGCLINDY